MSESKQLHRFDPKLVAVLPAALVARPTWVCWGPKMLKDGKVTKAPHNPRNGLYASAVDPQTWGTMQEAVLALGSYTNLYGIGYVFDNCGLWGLDMDHCYATLAGERQLLPWAKELLDFLTPITYVERSPSHEGFHAFLWTDTPTSRKSVDIECYFRARYFTVTGEKLPEAQADVGRPSPEVWAELMALLKHHMDERMPGRSGRGYAASVGPDDFDADGVPRWYQLEIDPGMPELLSPARRHELMHDEAFLGIWHQTRRLDGAQNDQSDSAYEMSIATRAAMQGLTAQEICSLLVLWRDERGLDSAHLRKLQRTIYVALKQRRLPPAAHGTNGHSAADTRADLLDDDTPLDDDPDYQARLESLSNIHLTMGLDVTRVVQYGRDDGRYRLVLKDDVAIDLGTFANMEKQATWRRVIFEYQKRYLEKIPKNVWEPFIRSVFRAVEYEDDTETGTLRELATLLDEYLGQVGQRQRGDYEHIRRYGSFYDEDGYAHISLLSFVRHIHVAYQMRWTSRDVAHRMAMLGWSPVDVHRRDVKRVGDTTPLGPELYRRYWRAGYKKHDTALLTSYNDIPSVV